MNTSHALILTSVCPALILAAIRDERCATPEACAREIRVEASSSSLPRQETVDRFAGLGTAGLPTLAVLLLDSNHGVSEAAAAIALRIGRPAAGLQESLEAAAVRGNDEAPLALAVIVGSPAVPFLSAGFGATGRLDYAYALARVIPEGVNELTRLAIKGTGGDARFLQVASVLSTSGAEVDPRYVSELQRESGGEPGTAERSRRLLVLVNTKSSESPSLASLRARVQSEDGAVRESALADVVRLGHEARNFKDLLVSGLRSSKTSSRERLLSILALAESGDPTVATELDAQITDADWLATRFAIRGLGLLRTSREVPARSTPRLRVAARGYWLPEVRDEAKSVLASSPRGEALRVGDELSAVFFVRPPAERCGLSGESVGLDSDGSVLRVDRFSPALARSSIHESDIPQGPTVEFVFGNLRFIGVDGDESAGGGLWEVRPARPLRKLSGENVRQILEWDGDVWILSGGDDAFGTDGYLFRIDVAGDESHVDRFFRLPAAPIGVAVRRGTIVVATEVGGVAIRSGKSPTFLPCADD